VVADGARVLHVVQIEGVGAHAGNAEVGGGAAGRHQELVVHDPLAVRRDQRAGGGVAAHDAGEPEVDAREAPQEAARGIDDRLGLQARRGDLVQQGQERMVVARVEPQHALPRTRQPPDRPQASESGAQDDDPRGRRRGHGGRSTTR